MRNVLRFLLVILSCVLVAAAASAGQPVDPQDIAGTWTGSYKLYPWKKCTMEPCEGNVTLYVAVGASQPRPDLDFGASFRVSDHEVSFSGDCAPASRNLRKWRGTLFLDVNRCRMANVTRKACETCLFSCGDGTCSHICWEGSSGCSVACAAIPFARWCGHTSQQEVCDQSVASERFNFQTKVNKKVTRMKVKGKASDQEKVKMTLDKAP